MRFNGSGSCGPHLPTTGFIRLVTWGSQAARHSRNCAESKGRETWGVVPALRECRMKLKVIGPREDMQRKRLWGSPPGGWLGLLFQLASDVGRRGDRLRADKLGTKV